MDIDDLTDVKRALMRVRAKWRDIGMCIGVDEGTLDTLKGKDPGESLSDLLRHWLKGEYDPQERNSKPRTWRTLIEALQDDIVNEKAMAKKIEREKCPPNTDQGT